MQKALPRMPDGAAVILNASILDDEGHLWIWSLERGEGRSTELARTWANELRNRRSRVNAVSPGPVHTPAIERATGGRENAMGLLSELVKEIPLGRIAQGEDVASAVAFLASDDASFINGIELFVDGGVVQT